MAEMTELERRVAEDYLDIVGATVNDIVIKRYGYPEAITYLGWLSGFALDVAERYIDDANYREQTRDLIIRHYAAAVQFISDVARSRRTSFPTQLTSDDRYAVHRILEGDGK